MRPGANAKSSEGASRFESAQPYPAEGLRASSKRTCPNTCLFATRCWPSQNWEGISNATVTPAGSHSGVATSVYSLLKKGGGSRDPEILDRVTINPEAPVPQ